jgi:dienelactone hydrolase
MTLPYISIKPDRALADRRVDVCLGGFEAGQRFTLRAHMRDDLNRLWLSHALFEANEGGEVSLSQQAPLSGTYGGIDAMGLFWSMSLDPGEGEVSRFLKRALTPIALTFTAEVDWEPVATASLERIYVSPDVERVKVRENWLVATFFYPRHEGPHPGVIVIGSADGGLYEGVAARLASHGFAALSIAYIGIDHLSQRLANVPLEYFKLALAWMGAQPQVDGERVGLVGWSKGAEAALLVGASYPQMVSSVVAYVPSSVLTGSSSGGLVDLTRQEASWSRSGRPLPFLPLDTRMADEASQAAQAGQVVSLRPLYEEALKNREAAEGAAIPVERIDGPVLLISGGSDGVWPSTPMSKAIMERLSRHNRPHRRKHLSYPDAGHSIGVPYRPTTVSEHRTPSGALLQFGGTAPGNAHAEADSWPKMIEFLREG